MSVTGEEQRIFNRRGRRHFRRTYSTREAKAGVLVGLGLVLIASWVHARGRHPDPELMKTAAELMGAPPAVADRGPIPSELAPPGWRERSLSVFGPENVYEKINGREGYYKSFGFERLYFVALEAEGGASIDLELYDLGRVENALGALAGELPETGQPRLEAEALVHAGRNAVLLGKGRFYGRLIGADEAAPTKVALEVVARRLLAAIPGAPLPLGFALFAGLLGLPPDRVGFEAENAFSFGFARDVHVGRLADESELFVTRAPSEVEAASLVERFERGFREYGEDGGAEGGVRWVKDRYLSSFAGAKALGARVIGVRGAADRPAALAALERLEAAVRALPPERFAPAPAEAPGAQEVPDER